MVFMDRRYWRYVAVPWLWSAAIFLAIVVVGYFALVPWLRATVDSWLGSGSRWSGPAQALVSFAYIAIWFLIAGFVFLLITSVTSSFLWDDLSRRVEEQVTGQPGRKSTLTTSRIISDSVSRGVFAILVAILSLGCGWIIPFVVPIILAGWLGLLDYTSPAFLRHDQTVGQQWPKATKMKGWFGFQLASGVLSLLPFINVLMLPALVAGGTAMAVRSKVLPGEH